LLFPDSGLCFRKPGGIRCGIEWQTLRIGKESFRKGFVDIKGAFAAKYYNIAPKGIGGPNMALF
jgi:hypothetical protein